MKTNKFKNVADALIWFDNKVLLGKRKNTKSFNDYYDGVGGKLEDGELPLDAIIREIKEEAGLTIYWPTLINSDLFISQDGERQIFIYETWLPLKEFKNVKNMEPNKKYEWKLFSREEALKLKLIPRLNYYIASVKLGKLRTISEYYSKLL